MAELIPPNSDFGRFQSEIVYEDGFTPNEMAGRTVEIISNYFRSDPNWMIKSIFLSSQTLPFVRSAQQGFLKNPQVVRDISLIDPDNLNNFVTREDKNKTTRSEELEAFSRIYIGFGMIPEIAVKAGLPHGFSRIQLLEPPFTTNEVIDRIDEVGVVVNRLKNRQIDPSIDIINNPALLRTYWTFRAIESMPLKTPEVA